MKEYKVSVVTPFHNVDMSMFNACVASMRAQTIGFENIEWIIVVHNSEAGYMEQLTAMFKDDENVILKEIHDNHQTPSSPRNHGTELATAPYVGYLDGDDSYLPNCLEVAVREAADTRSQMVWFRRELEKENPAMRMSMATTLWNNTMERVIVEKDNWDDEKMFFGLFGFATSYIYETRFLRENNLSFSTTMLFGEDFLFVVETAAHADRICYLPQHIGYHYYVNGNSLVQKGEKSADLLIQYAQGFHNLFETMRNYGINAQENSQIQCGVTARFILSSPGLTVADRQKIKEILGSDVSSMHLLPPNKSFNKKSRAMMFRMSQDVILNPENPGEFMMRVITDGTDTLLEILSENADTDMGRRYKFRQLESLKAFQNRLPIADAAYYAPLVRLQTNVGESTIFTANPIKRYLRNSAGALIPTTESQAHQYAECFASQLHAKNNLLIARSYPILNTTNDGADVDTLGSAIVKDYFSGFYFKGGIQQAVLSSSIKSYFAQNNDGDDYADLMADALENADIDQIVALNTAELLVAFQTLERDWRTMVGRMREGERKEQVSAILSAGFDQPVAARLWPRLERVVAFGTGEMYESMKQLQRYTGGVSHNHGHDFIEETVLGKATEDGSELFVCLRGVDFYEFLPIMDDAAGRRALSWTQVETGQSYFLIVTNHSGLYRYHTDHIVVPCEITPEVIKFRVY